MRLNESLVPSVHARRLKPTLSLVTEPVLHGEGPHWDTHKQVLLFVDISGQAVHRVNPATNKHSFVDLNDTVSFVIPIRGRTNQFVIGLGLSIQILTWDGVSSDYQLQAIDAVDHDKEGNRLNDAKADPSGVLWAGTMGEESPVGIVKPKQGSLHSWSNQECSLSSRVQEVSVSNGLAWSSDRKHLYYTDTATRKVDVFDYNGSTISNRRVVFDFEKHNIPGYPDGMTIDKQDNLWIACWGGSRVIQVDPRQNKLKRTITLPAERITSVTFGGAALDTLYVTSMRQGLNASQLLKQPLAGATFAIHNLPVTGTINNPVDLHCVK
ncbi:regucalcin isoform X3 [Nilaparvata lugens]|uniref:regucalcin isoform X3 n=1 Tax=Nilaparvata lugens TaxID=108931 RepID=UPI00193E3722|nr:regucalcin isoform X3 [Nilaparvata lugens]